MYFFLVLARNLEIFDYPHQSTEDIYHASVTSREFFVVDYEMSA